MAIILNDSIRVQGGKPVEDKRLNNGVVYNSVIQANTLINKTDRYPTLEVAIKTPIDTFTSIYWYKEGIENSDLVLKQESGGGSVTDQDNIQRIVEVSMEDIGALESDTEEVVKQKMLGYINDSNKNPYFNVSEVELPPKFKLIFNSDEVSSAQIYTLAEKIKLSSLENVVVTDNPDKAEQTMEYSIVLNAYINSSGAYTTGTNWKYASVRINNGYKKIRFSGISARPGNDLFYNFASTSNSTTPISFGKFVANDVIELDIPNGATYLNVNVKASTDANDLVFANLKFEYLTDKIVINGYESEGVTVNSKTPLTPSYIIDNIQGLRRKATICFTFDDGGTTDINAYNKLRSYGYKGSFALITNTLAVNRISTYLGFQDNGFEILSHSVSHLNMSNPALSETNIRIQLANSLNKLREWGFVVNGFVTPYSKMAENFIPIMNEYYNYGFTVYYGQPTPELTAHHKFKDSLLSLKRLNIEGTDIEGIKNEILKTVAEKGILFIYAHSFPNGSGLTDANFTEILNYVKTFTDAGTAQVLTPTEAINDYFKIRHEDLVPLLNS